MKEKQLEFVRKVAFTTFVSFFLIGFLTVGLYSLFGKTAQPISELNAARFFLGKLYVCVFPFSLCLGFLNRLPERKGNRAVNRVLHILLGLVAYFIFMDLIYNYFFRIEGEIVPVSEILKMLLPYFVGYPITLWVTALGRALFLPKEKKTFKSILD